MTADRARKRRHQCTVEPESTVRLDYSCNFGA